MSILHLSAYASNSLEDCTIIPRQLKKKRGLQSALSILYMRLLVVALANSALDDLVS